MKRRFIRLFQVLTVWKKAH